MFFSCKSSFQVTASKFVAANSASKRVFQGKPDPISIVVLRIQLLLLTFVVLNELLLILFGRIHCTRFENTIYRIKEMSSLTQWSSRGEMIKKQTTEINLFCFLSAFVNICSQVIPKIICLAHQPKMARLKYL